MSECVYRYYGLKQLCDPTSFYPRVSRSRGFENSICRCENLVIYSPLNDEATSRSNHNRILPLFRGIALPIRQVVQSARVPSDFVREVCTRPERHAPAGCETRVIICMLAYIDSARKRGVLSCGLEAGPQSAGHVIVSVPNIHQHCRNVAARPKGDSSTGVAPLRTTAR